MKLNDLRDNVGTNKARKRVGRGIGSGSGKTCGTGHKGQKSRSGVTLAGFEGGQMPLARRLPKRGFNPLNPKEYAEVNLERLQKAVDSGRLKADKPLTESDLVAAGVAHASRDGVRLLGKGTLKAKLQLTVTGASAGAVAAVEKAGGKVTVTGATKAEAASA